MIKEKLELAYNNLIDAHAELIDAHAELQDRLHRADRKFQLAQNLIEELHKLDSEEVDGLIADFWANSRREYLW